MTPENLFKIYHRGIKITMYYYNGALRKNDPTYIIRACDQQLLNAVQDGQFCYILDGRQMGKTSLAHRAIHSLRKLKKICIFIDLSPSRKMPVAHSRINDISVNALLKFRRIWYDDIVIQIHGQIELSTLNIENWLTKRESYDPCSLFRKYFVDILLPISQQQEIIIFWDEIDSVISLSFDVDDFFSTVRAFHNDPRFQEIRHVFLGTADPSWLVKDASQTPFNIGIPIQLNGFTLSDIEPLLPPISAITVEAREVLKEILYWTEGQPFLTQKICQLFLNEIKIISEVQNLDIPRFIETLVKEKIIKNWSTQDQPRHLMTIQERVLNRNPSLTVDILSQYQKLFSQKYIDVDNRNEQIELRLTGLVKLKSSTACSQLEIYNPIYAAVFNQDWVQAQLTNIRPYGAALSLWIHSQQTEESALLTGKILRDAISWSQNKTLSLTDYQFLG